MKTKKQILEYLDYNGLDWFLSAIEESFSFNTVSSDCDCKSEAVIIDAHEYMEVTGFKPFSFHFYQSSHCGCEYDCCGCISSVSIDVCNNKNGFVTVFRHVSFNY